MIGSGLYCDGEVGAAVATGDGEEVQSSNFVTLLTDRSTLQIMVMI